MPELPEVETVRRQLEPVLVGQTIRSIEVLRDKSWSGDIDDVIDCKIVAVKRKAKILIIDISHQSSAINHLLIHLKMTGQLIYEPKIRNSNIEIRDKSKKQNSISSLTHQPINPSTRIVGGHPNNSWTNKLPDKHTRVIIQLNKGTLYFNDQRVFGWVKLVSSERVNEFMDTMPPDIIDDVCDSDYFYTVLQSSGRAVKLVILDSKKIGGIGNIYACDGLFDAGIDPRRPAKELSRTESDKLLASLKKVVNLGIDLGGATAADGKFVNTQGYGGTYQNHFLVYEQEGVIVEKNGKKGVVEKFKLGGRGTYWVPKLQK